MLWHNGCQWWGVCYSSACKASMFSMMFEPGMEHEWYNWYNLRVFQSINGVLEFPLSLTISVPAQIPNWSIVADITSSLGKVRRSPLQVLKKWVDRSYTFIISCSFQCREHLMNVVIPREEGSAKVRLAFPTTNETYVSGSNFIAHT